MATLAMAVLVGCTGSSGTDSGSSGSGSSGSDSGAAAGPVGSGDPEVAPAVPDDADADRQVVTTAHASLVVEDPGDSAQRVSELVESAGGRVEERAEQASSEDDGAEGAVADLVVRVPASELTGVLADLEDLGDVRSVSVSRSDVTATAVDLDARISSLQTSVARLQVLMDGAATTEALLAAEGALSGRQEQLESLQAQRALLAGQVELSTLGVHLASQPVEEDGGSDGFLDGLGTGWRALGDVGSAAVVVLGILLPWVALAVLVGGAVLLPVRLLRRRHAGEAAAPPQG